MKTISKKTCFATLIFLLGFCGSATAAEMSPADSVKTLLTAIKKIETGGNLSPEQKTANEQSVQTAIAFLDMDGVSRETLGKYWKERSPEEQKNFVGLLTDVFKKTAFPNSAKFFGGLDLIYGKTRNEKDLAIVPLTVVHKDEGEILIDFILHEAQKKWMVFDVILDGVSMRNNLKNQFHKIISKDGFPELVKRMNDKLTKVGTDR